VKRRVLLETTLLDAVGLEATKHRRVWFRRRVHSCWSVKSAPHQPCFSPLSLSRVSAVLPFFAEGLLKLADLGSCRGIHSRKPYTEYISTRWYRAPECLLTDGYYGPEMVRSLEYRLRTVFWLRFFLWGLKWQLALLPDPASGPQVVPCSN
jgi:hypothetical protein